jgi:hypothetical protein
MDAVESLAPSTTPINGAALQPFALKDAPAQIKAVFPAQKVSFEAQRERKAGAGQTLTTLGSYWKGRKPLILVRVILLGSLLPQTDHPQKDLEVFEQLMAFDEGALARREPKLEPADIAERVALAQPWRWFSDSLNGQAHTIDDLDPTAGRFRFLRALAQHQGALLGARTLGRTPIAPASAQGRAEDLAAALLEACDPRPAGLGATS